MTALWHSGLLLHRVAASFEAGAACFLIGGHAGLVLLRRGLLLLLPLRGVLTTALAASCDSARCGAGTGIAHDSADNCATRRPARARAGRGAARGGRRRRGRGLLRRVGRVILALLYGPRMTLSFIFLLLVRRLALGRLDVLLRRGARRKRRGNDQGEGPL